MTAVRHAATTAAISVSGLDKSFGRTKALDQLDLTVHTGEVHGFLGPNGAGKSTTIRILLGLLRPDRGSMSVLGGDQRRDAVSLHRRLTYVAGDVNLWPNLTGGEAIDLFARLRGGFDKKRRNELCERFDLDPRLGHVVESGSLSELRHLTRSLVSQPPTLEQLFMRHYGEDLTVSTR